MKVIGDLSRADISVLHRFGNKSKRILEFGAGGSTHIFSQCVAPEHIVSVETAQEWIDITQRRMATLENPKPVHFIDYNIHALQDTHGSNWDLIFIDGMDNLRHHSAHRTWADLNIGGVMMFHDTRREQDIKNAMSIVSTYYNEIESVLCNYAGSNITVITKKKYEPWENWNHTEGKPMWAYGHDMNQIHLWEDIV